MTSLDHVSSRLAAHHVTSLYHMTAIANVPSILRDGIQSHRLAHGSGRVTTDISEPTVQARRAARLDTRFHRPLHDYACLYFNPRNPMLYRRLDQRDDIAILLVDPAVMLQPGAVFTDGNAASGATRFFSDMADLERIDWSALWAAYWTGCDHTKRVKCAEVLVPDRIEPNCIVGIHVRREAAARALVEKLPPGGLDKVYYNSGLFF